jgi:putative SOS response-associated peptidase YedK
VPFWADDPRIGNRMINARAESVATKSAYRHAFKKQRCLIPADGFYEWKAVKGQKRKQPYYIHRPDGEPYAFAGLWETWKPRTADGNGDGDGDEERLVSCTIITGTANAEMAKLHDRMPVMLPADRWAIWLDEDNHDTEALGQLLVPAPERLITFHPVSLEVGNPRNKGAHLVEPAAGDATLFGDDPADGGNGEPVT